MQRVPDGSDDNADGRAFAKFLREVGDRIAEREAANPTPKPPRDPEIGKPASLIAAENEAGRWQLLEKLRLAFCGGPDKCSEARCRRARRCAALEEIRPEAELARAALARERAKWTPPPAPPQPPKARPRGRTRRV